MAAIDQKFQIQNTAAMVNFAGINILGDEHQILSLSLAPGQEVVAEPGAFMYGDDCIKSEVNFGTLGQRFFRSCFADESATRIHWSNAGKSPASVSFAPTRGKVVPINLDQRGGEMFIEPGSFMATTDPDMDFDIVSAGNAAIKAAKGGSLYYLKICGSGLVFLNSGGTICTRMLAPGETIVVDRSHILAWDTTVKRGSRRTGGIGMMFAGGEGLTNGTFTGPGLVILNSDPSYPVRGAQ